MIRCAFINNLCVCTPVALFEGFGLRVNVSTPKAVVRLPFPPTTAWYITLQLLCSR